MVEKNQSDWLLAESCHIDSLYMFHHVSVHWFCSGKNLSQVTFNEFWTFFEAVTSAPLLKASPQSCYELLRFKIFPGATGFDSLSRQVSVDWCMGSAIFQHVSTEKHPVISSNCIVYCVKFPDANITRKKLKRTPLAMLGRSESCFCNAAARKDIVSTNDLLRVSASWLNCERKGLKQGLQKSCLKIVAIQIGIYSSTT